MQKHSTGQIVAKFKHTDIDYLCTLAIKCDCNEIKTLIKTPGASDFAGRFSIFHLYLNSNNSCLVRCIIFNVQLSYGGMFLHSQKSFNMVVKSLCIVESQTGRFFL